MLNLCLVVITGQFVETKEREKLRMKMERKLHGSASTLNSTATSIYSMSIYRQVLRYFGHFHRRAKRRFVRSYRAYRAQKTIKNMDKPKPPGETANRIGRDNSRGSVVDFCMSDKEFAKKRKKSSRCQLPQCCLGLQKHIYNLVEHKHFQTAMLAAIMINTLSMAIEHHNQVILISSIIFKY